MFATYTTAHGNALSLTHWARPGTEPASSWILVRFVSAEPRQELHVFYLKVPPFSFSFSLFFFWGPYLWHKEVPRLAVKLELHLQAYATTMATPDRAASATYTTACGNVGPLTYWAKPGTNKHPHGYSVRFLTHRVIAGTPTHFQKIPGMPMPCRFHPVLFPIRSQPRELIISLQPTWASVT